MPEYLSVGSGHPRPVQAAPLKSKQELDQDHGQAGSRGPTFDKGRASKSQTQWHLKASIFTQEKLLLM